MCQRRCGARNISEGAVVASSEVVCFLVLCDRLKTEGELRVKAETQLAEAQTSLDEPRKLLQESKAELTDTFNALSAEALNSNNEPSLALARSTFEGVQT